MLAADRLARPSGADNATRGHPALPTGVAARLGGNRAPTAPLVTSDGLCVGATVKSAATGINEKTSVPIARATAAPPREP